MHVTSIKIWKEKKFIKIQEATKFYSEIVKGTLTIGAKHLGPWV